MDGSRVGVCALVLLSGCGPRAVPETHLLPAGYSGPVHIIFGIKGAAPVTVDEGRRIYRIPRDGLLLTSSGPNLGWSVQGENTFEFIGPNGGLLPIAERWHTTVRDTPEARADPVIGAGYHANGTAEAPPMGCKFQYSQYFVGTKAQLLDTTKLDAPIDRVCSAISLVQQ